MANDEKDRALLTLLLECNHIGNCANYVYKRIDDKASKVALLGILRAINNIEESVKSLQESKES